jgi:hypothetical protein
VKSLLLGSKDRLGRRFAVAFAIVAMFASVCGGASAQSPTYVSVTVVLAGTPPPPPAACGPPSGGYMICVDKEPISTSGNVGDDVEIIWNLASSGWSFVKNKGIEIKNQKNWKVKPDSSMPSTKYAATNKKEGGFSYKYEINVTNGTALPPWDPTIMN